MGFWLGILFGAIFVYIAVKIGFYETWVLLLNLVVSIYLAVFLRPIIEELVPAAGDTKYSAALIILSVGIGSFAILYGISFVFFTSQFNVPVPRVLDVVGSGFLGFWAGLLVWSFAIIIISVMPISQNSFLRSIGFTEKFQQTNVAYMSWWVNKVNNLVAYKSNYLSTEELIDELQEKVKQKPQKERPSKTPKSTEPNEPNETAVEGYPKTCPEIAEQSMQSSEKTEKAKSNSSSYKNR